MSLQPQITFRNLEVSDAIKDLIARRVADFERISDRITACKVVVETGHRRHHGGLFHVTIHLTLPGEEIAVTRDPKNHHAHEDIHAAIRDAFDAALRQLEDYIRSISGDKKHSKLELETIEIRE